MPTSNKIHLIYPKNKKKQIHVIWILYLILTMVASISEFFLYLHVYCTSCQVIMGVLHVVSKSDTLMFAECMDNSW
jgi:hypothetical protein